MLGRFNIGSYNKYLGKKIPGSLSVKTPYLLQVGQQNQDDILLGDILLLNLKCNSSSISTSLVYSVLYLQ